MFTVLRAKIYKKTISCVPHILENCFVFTLKISLKLFFFSTVPATIDDLPDMYETLEGLDTDEIELNLKTSPPSILTNDQQQEYQNQVQSLKQGIYDYPNSIDKTT